MSREGPPRLFRWLVRRATVAEERRWIMADLEEEFEEIRDRRGPRAARRWYRSQALRSALHGLRRRLELRSRRTSGGGVRQESVLASWGRDLATGARSLWRAPGYTAVTLSILALGIGANATVFSLATPYLFRELPFDEPGRLVHLFESDSRLGWPGGTQIRQSLPTYRDWVARADAFEEMGAYLYAGVNLSGDAGEPERLTMGRLSASLPRLLGVEPLHGRWFGPDDDAPGDGDVVVLGHGLWRRRFAGDPAALGAEVRIDGVPHTIVGVAPPEFVFPYGGVPLWAPLALSPGEHERDERLLMVVGRLAPGTTLEEARSELAGIHAGLVAEYPDAYDDTGIRVVPLREALTFFYDLIQGMLVMLLVTVGIVLLVVCANVAGLMLSRTVARRHDLAIRAGLGASRGRLVRELLAESTLLTLAAGALGSLLASWVVGVLAPAIPSDVYRVGEIRVDYAALGYTFFASLVAALAVGATPALRLSRVDLAAVLRAGGSTTGPRAGRFTGLLVVAQVACALVLGVGALATVEAAGSLGRVDLGIRPDGVLTTSLAPPATTAYPGREEIAAFYDEALAGVRALPGVESAALVDYLPADFAEGAIEIARPGAGPASGEAAVRVAPFRVSPEYFRTLGIELLRGRAFQRTDTADAARVVVVNETLSQRLWPDGEALGRRVDLLGSDGPEPATVVGVVADAVGGILFTGTGPQVFIPWQQTPARRVHLVIRAGSAPGADGRGATGTMPDGTAAALAGAVRERLRGIDPDLPLGAFRTMDEILEGALGPLRMSSWVVSGFGLFALVLASMGIYGLVARSVSARTREIGVRIALGARARDVRLQVLRHSAGLVAAGLAVGLVVSTGFVWLMVAGTPPSDSGAAVTSGWWMPPSLALVLAFVAGLAGWIPSRRATRVDPVRALRGE